MRDWLRGLFQFGLQLRQTLLQALYFTRLLAEDTGLQSGGTALMIQHQQGSTSLLQRRLKVGYGRAARIIDQLHAAGVLGPPDGSKPRDVLVGFEEIERICSRV